MNEKKWKSVKQQRVKQQEKIREARSWLFKEVNKIHKTPPSLINKKKRKHTNYQYQKQQNEREGSIDIECILWKTLCQ